MSKNKYSLLLNQYFKIIHSGLWWDGRREILVEKMDKEWTKMNNKEKESALQYAYLLYHMRID